MLIIGRLADNAVQCNSGHYKTVQLKIILVLVLLSTHVKRFSVSRMRDFYDKIMLRPFVILIHPHLNICIMIKEHKKISNDNIMSELILAIQIF